MNFTLPRRWFSFSLRTMFILLTAVCVWVGYQVNWVRQRREFMGKLPTNNIAYQEDLSHQVQAPGMLWLFGEAGKHRFRSVNTPDSDPETKQIRILFPEAEILQIN